MHAMSSLKLMGVAAVVTCAAPTRGCCIGSPRGKISIVAKIMAGRNGGDNAANIMAIIWRGEIHRCGCEG